MAQKLIQEQVLKQQLQQRLSAQQMLQVRLLEMPLTELEGSINAELDDNPALETGNENENDTLNDIRNENLDDSENDYDADSRQGIFSGFQRHSGDSRKRLWP